MTTLRVVHHVREQIESAMKRGHRENLEKYVTLKTSRVIIATYGTIQQMRKASLKRFFWRADDYREKE